MTDFAKGVKLWQSLLDQVKAAGYDETRDAASLIFGMAMGELLASSKDIAELDETVQYMIETVGVNAKSLRGIIRAKAATKN